MHRQSRAAPDRHRRPPWPGSWLNGTVSLIILLGQSLQDSATGKDIYTAFAVRMELFVAVTL